MRKGYVCTYCGCGGKTCVRGYHPYEEIWICEWCYEKLEEEMNKNKEELIAKW